MGSKHIKTFENFSAENASHKIEELYIFDFDDTLVRSPYFNDLIIQTLNEGHTLSSLLNICLNEIGASVNDLKHENGRIYVLNEQRFQITPNVKNWVVKGSRIYMTSPTQFSLSDISLPTEVNPEIAHIYKMAKNKAIITARSFRMEDKVKDCLTKFNLELPNRGLFTYPGNSGTTPKWKSDVISQLIFEYNPTKVYFYDDNRKTIKAVDKMMASKFPNVEYESIKVENAIEEIL